MNTILYVEDEADVREGFARALNRVCDKLYLAADGQQGLELYRQYQPDIVISDIKMPVKNGIEMVRDIIQENPGQPVLFTSAHSDTEYFLHAIEMQVEGYLLKPVNKQQLKQKIKAIFKSKQQQQQLALQRQIIQKIIDNHSNMTLVTDFNEVLYLSESFRKFFDPANTLQLDSFKQEMAQLFCEADQCLYAPDLDELYSQYQRLKRQGAQTMVCAVNPYNGLEHFFQIEMQHFEIPIEENQQNHFCLLHLYDITDIEKQKENALYEAEHDHLTGIYNRRKFEEIFAYEFRQSQRYLFPLSMAIMDIDHFKKINDQLGHATGDKVLQQLARRLLQRVRKTDTLARWGGEEFALIMPKTEQHSAREICDAIRVDIMQHLSIENRQITISIGIAQLRQDEKMPDFFNRCDEVLYQAKQNGRNQVALAK